MNIPHQELILRETIATALQKAGGTPGQAILCEGPNLTIFWACQKTAKRVLVMPTSGKGKPKLMSRSMLTIEGGARNPDSQDFPGPPPIADFDLERRMQYCKNPTVVHNGKCYLAWYHQSIQALHGLLTKNERAQELKSATLYKETLDRMLAPQIPSTPQTQLAIA